MNKIDIANGLVFQGLHIKKESFADRLVAQKKMYLLQALGSDLGYQYNWYLHGPYSPTLTGYVYANLDWINDSSDELKQYNLSENTRNHIQRVNDLEQKRIVTGLTQSDWYELLASLHYISHNRKSWDVRKKEDVFQKLQKYKPKYSEEECKLAFSILEKEGFLK